MNFGRRFLFKVTCKNLPVAYQAEAARSTVHRQVQYNLLKTCLVKRFKVDLKMGGLISSVRNSSSQ